MCSVPAAPASSGADRGHQAAREHVPRGVPVPRPRRDRHHGREPPALDRARIVLQPEEPAPHGEHVVQ
eukprot:1318344-Pyramimonas_sp.AAC.1